MCGDLKWTLVRGECLHKQLWLGRGRDQVNADKEEIPILPPCTSIGIEYSFNSNWDAHLSRKCLKERNSWLSVSSTEFHCRWFRTEISLNICQFHLVPWQMIWNWNIGVYPVLEKNMLELWKQSTCPGVYPSFGVGRPFIGLLLTCQLAEVWCLLLAEGLIWS
jgi:hypothetical protein